MMKQNRVKYLSKWCTRSLHECFMTRVLHLNIHKNSRNEFHTDIVLTNKMSWKWLPKAIKPPVPLVALKTNYSNFSSGNIWNGDQSRFSQEQSEYGE